MKAKVIKTGEIVEVYHEPQHGQVSNVYKESVLINGRIWMENELDFCPKANEAPDKIWVHELSAKELNVPLKEYHIEYVSTDAFIKKACEWLSKHAKKYYFNNDGHYLGTKELIEDFKLSMELWNNTFQNPL